MSKKKTAKQAATPPAAAAQPMVQAMVWYRQEDWDTLKTLFADADLLPETYS